ncbi:MAG TPA: PspA/IM30 family protein [Actinomycetaceae bacterium]|nr:PspA/IM30 family protein [Actinomycetaceae bacterium]
MAEKQSILGRIAQLTRANINAIIDRAEDPQKMLDQLVRDYTASIAEAEEAVAVTIGNLRLAERDYNEDRADARDWGNKALAASQQADRLRIEGRKNDADRFDNLARVALGKQVAAENEANEAEPMLQAQNEVVDKLKEGLIQMRSRLDELKSKRDELVARAKTAQAQGKVQAAISSINILDPTAEISRYEDQVRREEARVQGQVEVAAASIEGQFDELRDITRDAEVEARLALLKGGQERPQIEDGDDAEDVDWSAEGETHDQQQ